MNYKTNVAKFLYFLKTYGHARLVFPADDFDGNINFVYVFMITDDERLEIDGYRYRYDKTFYTDYVLEPSAKPMERKHIFNSSRFFRIPLKEVVLSDFNGNIIGANENVKSINYSKDVMEKLYVLFSSALNLTDEDLKKVTDGEKNISRIIKPIANNKDFDNKFNEETYIDEIEEKMLDAKRRLYDLGYEQYSSQLHLDLPGVVYDTKSKKNKK